MNKSYIIFPLVLTLAFSGLYYAHSISAAKEAEEKRLVAEKLAQETEAKKAEAERQAKIDADRRTAERLAEEAMKKEEKRAKWEATSKQIAEETAQYVAQAASSEVELKKLEAKLTKLRAEKDKAIQANFDFAYEIEKARLSKRTTELDIQRLVEMVARKNGGTLAPAGAIP